jgi:hypothetical protein
MTLQPGQQGVAVALGLVQLRLGLLVARLQGGQIVVEHLALFGDCLEQGDAQRPRQAVGWLEQLDPATIVDQEAGQVALEGWHPGRLAITLQRLQRRHEVNALDAEAGHPLELVLGVADQAGPLLLANLVEAIADDEDLLVSRSLDVVVQELHLGLAGQGRAGHDEDDGVGARQVVHADARPQAVLVESRRIDQDDTVLAQFQRPEDLDAVVGCLGHGLGVVLAGVGDDDVVFEVLGGNLDGDSLPAGGALEVVADGRAQFVGHDLWQWVAEVEDGAFRLAPLDLVDDGRAGLGEGGQDFLAEQGVDEGALAALELADDQDAEMVRGDAVAELADGLQPSAEVEPANQRLGTPEQVAQLLALLLEDGVFAGCCGHE